MKLTREMLKLKMILELWFLVVVVCELSVSVGHSVPPVPGILIPVRPEYNHQLDKVVKFFLQCSGVQFGGGGVLG